MNHSYWLFVPCAVSAEMLPLIISASVSVSYGHVCTAISVNYRNTAVLSRTSSLTLSQKWTGPRETCIYIMQLQPQITLCAPHVILLLTLSHRCRFSPVCLSGRLCLCLVCQLASSSVTHSVFLFHSMSEIG